MLPRSYVRNMMNLHPSDPLHVRVLEADVVVVGLGTAGALAALAAAQTGARVIGIERDSALGGTGTRAGVHAYYHGSHGGIQEEVDHLIKKTEGTLGARGGSYHPEAKRIVLTNLLGAEGVKVLFSTVLWGVELKDGGIHAVKVCDAEGSFIVRGKIFIDASGDGDLAAAAGAESSFGRQFDEASHQYSFVPRTLRRRSATSRWEVSFDNYDAGWVDPRDPWDITRAIIDAREQMHDYFSEQPSRAGDVIGTSSILGIREGRHIVGEHVVTFDDFLTGRTYPDVIITANSHYDNHTRDMANEPLFCQIWLSALAMYRKGVTCQIPFRSILVKGIKNLLVACRALSVDREVSMAVRMQRDMQKLGEAAGTAAALAACDGVEIRKLSIERLQAELIRRQVLKDEDLSCSGIATYNFSGGPLAGKHLVAVEVLRDRSQRDSVRNALPAYFGKNEEGKAFHWLRLLRSDPRQDLYEILADPDYRRRRSAAFALAFMEDAVAAPILLECLENRDPECPPPDIKTYPRWVAAIILLHILRSPSAFDEALGLLHEGTDDRYVSFLLAYFHELNEEWTPLQREKLLATLREITENPHLGRCYAAQGERSKRLDIRWNIDLWIARLFERLSPGDWEKLASRYAEDSRPFVRAIWQKFAPLTPENAHTI